MYEKNINMILFQRSIQIRSPPVPFCPLNLRCSWLLQAFIEPITLGQHSPSWSDNHPLLNNLWHSIVLLHINILYFSRHLKTSTSLHNSSFDKHPTSPLSVCISCPISVIILFRVPPPGLKIHDNPHHNRLVLTIIGRIGRPDIQRHRTPPLPDLMGALTTQPRNKRKTKQSFAEQRLSALHLPGRPIPILMLPRCLVSEMLWDATDRMDTCPNRPELSLLIQHCLQVQSTRRTTLLET